MANEGLFNVIKGVNNSVPSEFIKIDELAEVSNYEIYTGILKKRKGIYKQEDGKTDITVADNMYTANGDLITFIARNPSDTVPLIYQINKDNKQILTESEILNVISNRGVQYNGAYYSVQNREKTLNYLGLPILPQVDIMKIRTDGSYNDIYFIDSENNFITNKFFSDGVEKAFTVTGAGSSSMFIDDPALTELANRVYVFKEASCDIYDTFYTYLTTFTIDDVATKYGCTLLYNNAGTVEKYLVIQSMVGTPTIKAYKITAAGVDTSPVATYNSANISSIRIRKTYDNKIAYYDSSLNSIKFLTFTGSSFTLDAAAIGITGTVIDITTATSSIEFDDVPVISVLTTIDMQLYRKDNSLIQTYTYADLGLTGVTVNSFDTINFDSDYYLALHCTAGAEQSIRYFDINAGGIFLKRVIEKTPSSKIAVSSFYGRVFKFDQLYGQFHCSVANLLKGGGTKRIILMSYETVAGDLTQAVLLGMSYGDEVFLYDIPIGDANIAARHILIGESNGTEIKYLQSLTDETELLITSWSTASTTRKYSNTHFYNISAEDVCSHNKRLFIAGRGKDRFLVYYTNIGSEFIQVDADVYNILSMEENEASGITAIISAGGYLSVFTDNSIWRLTGWDQNTFSLVEAVTDIGCENKNTIAVYNNIIFFVNRTGVYAYDGSRAVQISRERIEGFTDTPQWDVLAKTGQAYMYYNLYCIYGPVRGNGKKQLLIYDTTIKGFYLYDFPSDYDRFIVAPETKFFPQMYFISSDGIFKFNYYDILLQEGDESKEPYAYLDEYGNVGEEYTDIPVSCYVSFKKESFDQETTIQRIYIKCLGTGALLTVKVYIDTYDRIVESSHPVQTDATGKLDRYVIRPDMGTGFGCQIRVENNDNKAVTLYGYELRKKKNRQKPVSGN